MKECTKCLIRETADTITFNKSGSCSVCEQVEFKLQHIDWVAKRRDLDVLVTAAKARNGLYDVIIPYSGGKDSVFILWFATTQLKLKPLVVRFDHWGYRPQTEENNVSIFRQLSVDFINFKPNWKIVRLLMLEMLKRRGDTCGFCHDGVFSVPMHMALKFDVPFVLWGEPLTEYASYGLGHDEKVDELRFNRAMNLGITADDLFQFLEGQVERRDLWPYGFPPQRELDAAGVQSVCLGSYIPWNTKTQVETIQAELGWKGDVVEGVPSPTYEKVECFMQGQRDFSKFIKRGFGRTNHLANIAIRHGHMTREDGDALQKEYDGKRPQSLDRFLELLGISEDEFIAILRTHEVDPWTSEGMNFETGPALPDIDKWR